MKKVYEMLLALTMILSFAFVVSAVENTEIETYYQSSPKGSVEVETPEDTENMHSSVQLIDGVNHIGKSSYDASFTCSPANGKTLNIHVENNGPGAVYFNVENGNEDFGTKSISSGNSLTRIFINPDGVHEEFIVNVFTKDGHVMDIVVNARQLNK